MPHSLLESKLLIAIITKPTTRTSIGLQWVRPFHFYFIQFFSTVFQPRHKLQYFEKTRWEDTWITTSREIVHTKFDQTYAFMDVGVERVFSQGRHLLSHIHSRLSVQTTRALLCLGVWSQLGFITDSDVRAAVVVLPEMNGDDEEIELDVNWDRIS